MKILPIILLVAAMTPSPCAAARIVVEKGVEIHETAGESMVELFIDDVMSVLPTGLAQHLAPEKQVLLRYAGFSPRDNYWSAPAVSKDAFQRRHAAGDTDGSTERLARRLGQTVPDIFEVAMSSAQDDPLGEALQVNLVRFLDRGRFDTHVITYRGYDGADAAAVIDRLYSLRGVRKTALYPELVAVTADLWTAMWNTSADTKGGASKMFVRRPFMSALPLPGLTDQAPAFPGKKRRDGKKGKKQRKYEVYDEAYGRQ